MMVSASVQIELDRVRNIRFDVNAISDLEDATNRSLADIINVQKMSFRDYRSMLWAGLRHEDPTLSIQAVGTMLQEHLNKGRDLGVVMGKIMKALWDSGVLVKQEAAKTEAGDAGNPPTAEAAA